MINFDQKLINTQRFQYFLHNGQNLSIRDHLIILAGYIKITLIELTEATFGDSRLISSVYFAYVESLYFLYVAVIGHISGKRHS